MGGFILNMMRLINHNVIIFRQKRAQTQILKKKGVVGHNHIGLFALALASEIAAFAKMTAAFSHTGVWCAVDALPVLVFAFVEAEMLFITTRVAVTPKYERGGKNAFLP